MCLRSVPLEDECNTPSKQFLDNENKLILRDINETIIVALGPLTMCDGEIGNSVIVRK